MTDVDASGPMDLMRAEIVRLQAEVERLQRRLVETEMLADRDPLTPVLNRRAFMRELSRIVAYCVRYETTAAVIFFDMDGFKAVNDTYGHAGGDAALQAVAATLSSNVRESDVVGRLGGDEFAVVLAQADPAAAMAKGRALCDLISGQPAVFEGRSIPLALSFGVRCFSPGQSAAELLSQADAAMYLHKGADADPSRKTDSVSR